MSEHPPAPWEGRRPVPEDDLVLPAAIRPHQGHRAGLVTRFAANAVDFAVVVAIVVGAYLTYAVTLFLIQTTSFKFPTVTIGRALLIGFVVMVVYLTGCWWAVGRTLGDQLLGLRVVNHAGKRLRFPAAFLRAVFCTFFPLGLFWVVVSNQNRSVQDVVLRTSCIYDWSTKTPPTAPLEEPEVSS